MGLWSNLLLLLVSFTGIVLAYPDTFQQAMRSLTGEAAPENARRMKPGKTAEVLPLGEYVHAALAAVPNGHLRELRLPAGRGRVVSIGMWAPGDVRPKGGTIVLLDPASANVLAVERGSPSKKFIDWANAIHKTELGGLPLRLAWAVLGLSLPLLFISGLQIWWNQRKAAARRTPVQPLEEVLTK